MFSDKEEAGGVEDDEQENNVG
jgi:hypothetical protein